MGMKGQYQNTSTQTPILTNKGGIPTCESVGAKGQSTPIEIESLQTRLGLLEDILSRDNMYKAYNTVVNNKGSPGVDGMTVEELKAYLQKEWQKLKAYLLDNSYSPQPVKRVEIPKPGGKKRKLGIPTVLDRLIQQAILQQIQPELDNTFSSHSYGFRPGRSTHGAVKQLQKTVQTGRKYVVDLDLEKFFDTVHHDRLMNKLRTRICDQRVLNLIRKYLNAGIMENGEWQQQEEGVPQGSPLSPLLSNLILDDLDKELEKRGHSFVRYADDCQILVRSLRSGERVLKSIACFIEKRLKLKVNREKSAVDLVDNRKFLGYKCCSNKRRTTLRIAPQSIQRLKDKVRAITKIRGGKSFKMLLKELKPLITGWRNYFHLAKDKKLLASLDSWIKRRLRACAYSLMKNGSKRLSFFIKEGIGHDRAYKCAFSSKGIWNASKCDVMQQVLSTKRLTGLGLVALSN